MSSVLQLADLGIQHMNLFWVPVAELSGNVDRMPLRRRPAIRIQDTLVRILLASAMISFLLAFFDEKSKEEGLKVSKGGLNG